MVYRHAAALLIALAVPSPSPTPLKTITHVRAQPLCIGLKRSVYPAVGRVLNNDRLIAQSRPFFRDYVKQSASGNQAGADLDVARLERYITPLVQNTKDAETFLDDSIFRRVPNSSDAGDLPAIRSQLQDVIAEQKQALNLISGFTGTQQLGELQQEDNPSPASGEVRNSPPPQPAPSESPNEILNAGIPDPQRSLDPRFSTTNSLEGYNPLNRFDQQMDAYQQQISATEDGVSKAIFKAVAACGGKAP